MSALGATAIEATPVPVGLVTTTGRRIPESCFDSFQFQDCSAEMFEDAVLTCADASYRETYHDGASVEECEAAEHDKLTTDRCLEHCGKEESSGNVWPWLMGGVALLALAIVFKRSRQ